MRLQDLPNTIIEDIIIAFSQYSLTEAFRFSLLLRTTLPLDARNLHPRCYRTLIPKIWQMKPDWASSKGHVELLQWWKESGLEMKYDEHSMDYPSRKNRCNVLQWWKDSGLELKYDYKAIYVASEYGHCNVLQWWKDSGLELKYDSESMSGARRYGHYNVLQWWKDSGLEYSVYSIQYVLKY
jgi:hypothetical protein